MNGKEPTTPERQNQRRGYSPAETAAVRSATIGEIVAAQSTLLTKSATKTDLHDAETVRKVTENLMRRCADLGCLPNFELLAASLGLSRRMLYKHIENHPDDETSRYLDMIRTAWAGMRQAAADKGAVDVTASIFVLLNSNLGFSNQHQIEISQPQSPLESTPEVISKVRERIMAALPDINEDE